MKARIQCEAITAALLQPGDLFSTLGPSYWDHFDEAGSIGERVFVRTNNPCFIADDLDATVFRLTIVREKS